MLSARPGASEVVLTYAVLADLLNDIEPDLLDGLPEPQRVAANRVLSRVATGPATDEHVVGAAFLSILTSLEERSPVLVAVDDLQWLDASSRAVLMFASRRVRGRVGVVVAVRSVVGNADPAAWLQVSRPDGVDRLTVNPLSLGGLHSLISHRLGRSLSRPTIVRIGEVSGGNPFYALELARATADSDSNPEVRLPRTLTALVQARLSGIDTEVRELLLAAASTAMPTVDIIARACGMTVGRVVELLETDQAGDIVRIDGNRVEFTHPLLATGLYTEATPAQRRAMHRHLATAIDQPELRARHLALSAATADSSTLEALDAAAEALSAQGAPMVAGELADIAIKLGGDTPLRRIRAASHHFRAADMTRAQRTVEPVLVQCPAGLMRAIAANLIATVHMFDDSFAEAAQLLTSVLDDAAENKAILARTLLSLSVAQGMNGAFDDALNRSTQAVVCADDCGDTAVLSSALALWVTQKCLYGGGLDDRAMRRALELEKPDSDVPVPFRPSAVQALLSAWVGELVEAKSQMARVQQACLERGADSDMMWIAGHTVLINIWLGDFVQAKEIAEDTMERSEQLGGQNMIVIARLLRVMVAAYTGDEASRADAREVITEANRGGSSYLSGWPTMTLGFIEVSMGRYAEAITTLQPVLVRFEVRPGTEILSSAYIADAVEALVGLGRSEEAAPMVEALERNGRLLDRPWMLAVGARGRSMLLAASGDLAAAEAHANQAMIEHRRLPMPFERARTQLLLGQVQRRLRHKDAAAATLSSALHAFEEMGTPIWAERARAELGRVSVGPRSSNELTPSEQRVADLVATGMTSRDVAAALFISPKTVEVNLTRIYRKLGIRSRAQLGTRLSQAGPDFG